MGEYPALLNSFATKDVKVDVADDLMLAAFWAEVLACAVMVADQIRDFLENGNITNSVNFPSLNLERTEGCYRIAYANNNVPRILGRVLSILADRDINVVDMLNKSREDVAYNIIDIETAPTDELVAEIFAIDGVVKVRTFGEIKV